MEAGSGPTGLRIVFMGTPDFAVPSLRTLLEAEERVVAVVTGPDRPRGRGQKVTSTPVKTLAAAHGVPVLQPPSLKDPAVVDLLRPFAADLFIVVAFRILPPPVFTLPRLGSFNLHASLLPRYRGAAPIAWALIRGETETGVTTFFLEPAVDTGKMLVQERTPILPADDAGTLHDRLAGLGAEVVLRTVRLIARGEAVSIPQDPSLATPAPKIFPDDCRILWTGNAEGIHNRIRGLSPSPGAFTAHLGRTIKVYRSRIGDPDLASTLPPGSVRVDASRGSLSVQCGTGTLEILELQLEGKRRMTTPEFLRGHLIEPGSTFGG
jgi:methionyl-tRNA formyltransferase